MKKEEYESILDAAGKDAKVWAVAPELDGIKEFVTDAKKYNPDCVISVAHSEAIPSQIEELIPYILKQGEQI